MQSRVSQQKCKECDKLTSMLANALQDLKTHSKTLAAKDEELRHSRSSVTFLEGKLSQLQKDSLRNSTCSLKGEAETERNSKFKEMMLDIQFTMQVENNKLRQELSSAKESIRISQQKDSHLDSLQRENTRLRELLLSLEGQVKQLREEMEESRVCEEKKEKRERGARLRAKEYELGEAISKIQELQIQITASKSGQQSLQLSHRSQLEKQRSLNSSLSTELLKLRKELMQLRALSASQTQKEGHYKAKLLEERALRETLQLDVLTAKSRQQKLVQEIGFSKEELKAKQLKLNQLKSALQRLKEDHSHELKRLQAQALQQKQRSEESGQRLIKELGVLKEERKGTSTQLSLAESRLQNKRKQNQVLCQKNVFFKQKIQAMSEEIKEHLKTLDQLRSNIQTQDSALLQARSQLLFQQDSSLILQQQIRDLQQREDEQSQSVLAYELSLESERQEKQESRRKCGELQAKVQQLEGRIAHLRKEGVQEVQSYKRRAQLLNQSNAALTLKVSELQHVSADISYLSENRRRLETQLQQKRTQTERHKHKVQLLQTEYKAVEGERRLLAQLHQQAEEEVSSLQEKIMCLGSDLQLQTKSRLELEQRLQLQTSQTQDVKAQNSKEIKVLSQMLASESRAKDSAHSKLVKLEQQLQELRDFADEVQGCQERSKERIQQLLNENCSLQLQLQNSREQLIKSEQRVRQLQEQVSALSNSETVMKLEQDLLRSQEQSRGFESSVEMLSFQKEQLEWRLGEMQTSFKSSECRLQEMAKLNSQLKDKLLAIQNKYLQNTLRLQRSLKQLETERTAMTLQLKALRSETIEHDLADRQLKRVCQEHLKELQEVKRESAAASKERKEMQVSLQSSQKELWETKEELRKQSKRAKLMKDQSNFQSRQNSELRDELQYERKRNLHLEELYLKYRNLKGQEMRASHLKAKDPSSTCLSKH